MIFIITYSTISNSVNFQNFLTKFCWIIAKIISIISCKCRSNWSTHSYFITKCAGLQSFLRHTLCQTCTYNCLQLRYKVQNIASLIIITNNHHWSHAVNQRRQGTYHRKYTQSMVLRLKTVGYPIFQIQPGTWFTFFSTTCYRIKVHRMWHCRQLSPFSINQSINHKHIFRLTGRFSAFNPGKLCRTAKAGCFTDHKPCLMHDSDKALKAKICITKCMIIATPLAD